ncbi:MAG: peptidylprolyl isomerase [Planctomycetota bacterium]
MSRLVTGSLLLASLLLQPALSAQQPAAPKNDEVFVEIDGEKITVDQFEKALFENYGVQYTNEYIFNYLVREQAEKLSVQVTEDEIWSRVNERFDQILTSQFQGDVGRFGEALSGEGYSPESWKRWLYFTMKPDILAEHLIRATRQITEAELREAWERQYGENGIQRTIRHILFSSNFGNSKEYTIDNYNAERAVIDTAAKQQAESLLQKVRSGSDLAELAREHSDDFSAAQHGSLGKNWRGRNGREFDRVIDELGVGEISDVFETGRGYHIAKVDGIQDGYEFRAKHILLGTALSSLPEAERKAREVEVLEKAESVLQQLLEHPEEFEAVAKQQSEDRVTRARGGDLGLFQRGHMVEPFENALLEMEPGDIVGPVRTRLGYHIIQLDSKERKPDLDSKIVSHILVSTEFYKVRERKLKPAYELRARNKASEVFNELRDGVDFDKLVRQHSDDNFSKSKGGVIETYTPALFGEEFDTAIETLQPGEIGRIVKSPRGYHIVQVTDIQETPFESVRDRLERELLERPIGPVEIREYKQSLRDEAKVVDTWNIEHAGGSVEERRRASNGR